MTITTVFDPPLPTDPPATFDSKAFTAIGSINAWSAEANALADEVSSVAPDLAVVASNIDNINAAVADIPTLAAKVSKTGDTMTGPLSVPAGASGTQVPQAQEVLPVTSPVGFNAIINGRMWLVPDGVTSWTDAVSVYMLGMWQFSKIGTGKVNAAQVLTGPAHCPNAIQFTCTTAQASMGVSDIFYLDHILEGSNSAQFIGKTFTLRGSIKSDVSGAVPMFLRNFAVTSSYVFLVDVVAGVETEFEHTVVGGLPAAADWGAGIAGGCRYGTALAAGSNYQAATPEVWTTGNRVGIAGQINAVGAIGRKIAFTNMSMVLGTAKPASADYGADALRMTRWYQLKRQYWGGVTAASTVNYSSMHYLPMRITPSASVADAASAGLASTPSVLSVTANSAIVQSSGTGSGAFYSNITLALSSRY